MIDFVEKYKKLSTKELLTILERHQDYKAEAVVAVREELESRKAGGEDLKEARLELESSHVENTENQRRKKENQQKIIQWIKEKSPIQGSLFLQKNQVILVTTLLVILFFVEVPSMFLSLKSPYSNDLSALAPFVFIALINLLIPILFANKTILGWILVVVQYLGSLFSYFMGFITWLLLNIQSNFSFLSFDQILFPSFQIYFSVIILLVVLQPKIRKAFRINKTVFTITLIITFGLIAYGQVQSYLLQRSFLNPDLVEPIELALPEN